MRKDQSKCGVTVTMLLFELNVSVHLLKFRETCCTVVAVCIMHMCTYGFRGYFHFTWNTTLLIKVWLDVTFKSLTCNQQVSLLFLFVAVFFSWIPFLCWESVLSFIVLSSLWSLVGFLALTPRLSCPWLSLGLLATTNHLDMIYTKVGMNLNCEHLEFKCVIYFMVWSSPGSNDDPI